MTTLTFSQFGMLKIAPLIPLAPLAGSLITAVTGSRLLRGDSHWPVLLGILLALLASGSVLGVVATMPTASPLHDVYARTYHLYQWIAPDDVVWFNVNLYIDPLAAVILVTVCAISLLVAVYSRDYMREHGHPDRGYARYFVLIGLFVFSMCVLVLAGNFLLLYLGWEAVGLCSYLLIGYYYDRPAAAAAAKKAFLVNRIGDFGFALGILCIYYWVSPLIEPGESPLDYAVVFEKLTRTEIQEWQFTTVSLLLFCGAVGKSAQLPLYVWLPDAMEGPSPVSALIHAATMVTAGVYMVARCGAIFTQSPEALAVVATIGGATALYAATIAVAQTDMKRILAYSTISQLGYMFLGLGVCAADSAVFHLFTHAFFKALLFLGAGSVMHAMGGLIDVREFSGLRRVMPVTYATFLVGGLALAGVPFFSGFFSKDEIIHAAFGVHPVLGVLSLATALLTAFYTFRMIFLAFHGPTRLPEGVVAHESGSWMLAPMVLLAVGALAAGYVGVHVGYAGFCGLIEPHGVFHRFLEPVFRHSFGAVPVAELRAEEHDHTLMYVSAALAIFGIAVAYVLYVRRRRWADALAMSFPDVHELVAQKYYIDELYDSAVVSPARQAGGMFSDIDNYIIDGLLWFVATVPRAAGFVLRGLQGGRLQGYALTMAVGVVVVLTVVMLAG